MLDIPDVTTDAPLFDVAVIIPSNHCHNALVEVALKVCKQSVAPSEIIIIDSSDERGVCPASIVAACVKLNITLKYRMVDHAYPGKARNIGLDYAKSNYIGFIDVKTIPKENWLEQARKLQSHPNISGIWGLTFFEATTKFEKLSRDGFFGRNPRKTLPGTVIRRETFQTIGRFLDWIRAGEDTEWLQRVKLSQLRFTAPNFPTLEYQGLVGQDLTGLAKKWIQNYSAAAQLPHLFPQKVIVWLIFYSTIILLAFNWNNLLAGWNTKSLLYIPNVTKITALIPIILYLGVRGLAVPYTRGVPFSELVPLRWAAIAITCLVGDASKAIIFLTKGKNAKRTNISNSRK